MLRDEHLPFTVGSTILLLEVSGHTLDLAIEDLRRPEETEVDRLPVLADSDLELRLPCGMGLRGDLLDQPQLPGIA